MAQPRIRADALFQQLGWKGRPTQVDALQQLQQRERLLSASSYLILGDNQR